MFSVYRTIWKLCLTPCSFLRGNMIDTEREGIVAKFLQPMVSGETVYTIALK